LIEQRRRDEGDSRSGNSAKVEMVRFTDKFSAGILFASAVQIDGGNRLALFQIAAQRRAEKHRRFEILQKPRFDPRMPAVRLIVGGLHLDEGPRQMLPEFDQTQT